MKIGIVNSGGDAQGINAVISSVVIYGETMGHSFVGFMKGWEGILDKNFVELNSQSVKGISHLGGTILHTVNKGRFAGKTGTGNVNEIPEEILNLVKTNLDELNVDCLIVIGGDGTLSSALQLYVKKGIKIIGVPKTIDNDLFGTDQTFGFDTAVDIVVEALDRIHTTAVSHDRVMFIETMGRHAGWIALHAGLAGGADAILIPEYEFTYQSLISFLNKRKASGRNYSIVVVAEGAKPAGEDISTKVTDPTRSEIQLGGISDKIMFNINKIAPGLFEMRNVVLGHTQRGGSPNATDRILARAYGIAAIDAITETKFGSVIAYKNGSLTTIEISEIANRLKTIDESSLALQTAKKLRIFLGK